VAEIPKSGNSPHDSDESDDSAHEKSESPHEEILETAKERFRLAVEAEAQIRELALDDLRFRSGEQWPDQVKAQRQADARPCLVINRLPQFIRQITNDQRQNRPAIKVHPVDDKADVDTAKVFQGLVRHIEYNSNADVAYDTAFDGAVTGGFGYFRVLTQYCHHQTFEQEILIKAIRNQFMVYRDPSSKEPDGSDMEWCFVNEDIAPEVFKKLYPKSQEHSSDAFKSVGDDAPEWMPGGNIRVSEYFYKEYADQKIVLLKDGTVWAADSMPEGTTEEMIDKRRTAKVPVIKWAKITGLEVLEEGEWAGQWIPIIPVYGEVLDINGKLIMEGVVRNAKDSQRMYNYWASSETETIALAPRVPFIGAEGQFEGYENQWKTANTKNHAFLQYKPITVNGEMAGPPQRQAFEAPVQAITMARQQAAEDLKATTGIYDAALGNKSNETSGIAIQRRNQQAQTSNFHFVDNLTRSLRHAGRILVDLIPKIYDTPRAARIIGEDGEQEIVRINEVFKKDGDVKNYQLSAGKYDVIIETGPSYATKRQESAASMIELSKANPQISQIAGDLMVRAMDWPGANEIADRLKKALPPGIGEDDKNAIIPPQVKQQMDQMGQMMDGLTKQLHAAHDQIEQKTLELESKERIEMEKLKVQAEIALLQVGSKESMALLGHQIGEIQHRLDLLHAKEQSAFQAEQAEQTQGVGPAGVEAAEANGGYAPDQEIPQ
jgi:hypothetical protein